MNKELLQMVKVDTHLYSFHKTHEKTASHILEGISLQFLFNPLNSSVPFI